MSFDREKHDEQIKLMAQFDTEPAQQNEEQVKKLIEKIIEHQMLLKPMKVYVDRKEIFKKLYLNLLESNDFPVALIDDMPEYLNAVGINDKLFLTEEDAKYIDKLSEKFNLPKEKKKMLKKYFLEIISHINAEEDKLSIKALMAKPDISPAEYLVLRDSLIEAESQNRHLAKKVKEAKKLLIEVYSGDVIEDIHTLNELCAHKKNVEIMIFKPEETDADLAVVIKMRAAEAIKKGNEFVLLKFDDLNKIVSQDGLIMNVNKLSFLQHGKYEFGYVEHINNYIDRMPDLKEIVLRGCGVAKNDENDKEDLYTVKMSKSAYEMNPSVQGNTQLIIQQKELNGKICSKLSWRSTDEDNKPCIKQINNIMTISKIDQTITDAQMLQIALVEGVPLLQHDGRLPLLLRDKFFNKNQVMTPVEMAKVKKTLRRSRTVESTAANDDLVSLVWSKLTPAQKLQVSVKGYVGGYQVYKSRVMPEYKHGQTSFSKAIRVGQKFYRSANDEKKGKPLNDAEVSKPVMKIIYSKKK